jgi:tRNA(Ile)-lysidine synthase
VSTAETAPVSAAELTSLFSGLEHLPALLLAVSGGPDSTALMLLAARWRQSLKVKPALIAVTVDHGLRAEAAREAAAVGRLARKLGLRHRTLRWTGAKPKTGLQQAARAARYTLLGEAARKAKATHILTAHTLDDQAETVLIRLCRGSGISGLGAMSRVSLLPLLVRQRAPSRLAGEGWGGGYAASSGRSNSPPSRPPSPAASVGDLSRKGGRMTTGGAPDELMLVRPLLDIPKARLIATLKAAGIAFADDPSNRDPRFMRARLRGLMPVLAREGLDARRLALLARRLGRADAAIEAAVDRAEAELARTPSAAGAVAFDAAGYAGLPAEVALRLIGRALSLTGDEGPVELAKLEALKTALDRAQTAGNARFRRSLAGAMVTLARGQIVVERAPARRGKALTTRRPGNARPRKSR